jgi:thiamine-phosphate pyrophosphorylase
MRRRSANLRGLYAITPEERDTAALVAKARAALEGGACALQYRAKSLPPPVMRDQALALQSICNAAGVPFIVNDDLELALALGADGVHLGRDDAAVSAARALFGGLIGVSCYADAARAALAAREGADYVAVGSVFPSATKPSAVRAPLALLAEARRAAGLPVVAIGGIDASNAAKAIEAGADMVAVISAVFDAPDVRGAARAIARLFPRSCGASDVRAQSRSL